MLLNLTQWQKLKAVILAPKRVYAYETIDIYLSDNYYLKYFELNTQYVKKKTADNA